MNRNVLLKGLSLILSIFLFAGCTASTKNNQSESTSGLEDFGQVPEETFSHNLSEGIEMSVHYLDVGQGDSIFIELPDHDTMLIDAGENDDGNIIVDYINQLGYDSIDYVVATHPHADHIGSMAYVLDNLPVDTMMYLTDVYSDTITYDNMKNIINKKDIPVTYCEGTQRLLEETVNNIALTIDCLGPQTIKSYEDVNDTSIIIKITYGQTSFLFMGDAEEPEELSLIDNVSADVLKVGHHGSSSSTSEEFLNEVDPKYAVISCGIDNKYGHPHKETIQKLNDRDIKALRTDELGTITINSNGSKVYVAEKSQYNIESPEPEQTIFYDGCFSETVITNSETITDTEETVENADKYYVINTKTLKFHMPDCPSVDEMADYNKGISYNTYTEIVNAGYVPCKSCNPS